MFTHSNLNFCLEEGCARLPLNPRPRNLGPTQATKGRFPHWANQKWLLFLERQAVWLRNHQVAEETTAAAVNWSKSPTGHVTPLRDMMWGRSTYKDVPTRAGVTRDPSDRGARILIRQSVSGRRQSREHAGLRSSAISLLWGSPFSCKYRRPSPKLSLQP